MAFDPDEFLAGESGGLAIAEPPARTSSFDPDRFLAEPVNGFDPDRFLAEETRQEKPAEPEAVPAWKQALQFGVSAGTGIERGIANTLKFAGRVSDAAGAIDPNWKSDPENNVFYRLGTSVEELSHRDEYVDPQLKGGFAEKSGGVVGTVLSYIPGGLGVALPRLFADGFEMHMEDAAAVGKDGTNPALAGGALNMALGLPIFKIAKGVARAIAPDAGPIIQETIRKVYQARGLPGVERLISALESKAPAAAWSEESTKGLQAALKSLDDEIKAPITASLRRIVKQSIQVAAVGGSVTTGHNLLAQNYDPERPTFQGVPEALLNFGVLGAIGAAAGERGTVKNAREAAAYLRQRFPQPVAARTVTPELPAPASGVEPTARIIPTDPAKPPALVLKSFSDLPTGEEMMTARIVAGQPSAVIPAPPTEPPPLVATSPQPPPAFDPDTFLAEPGESTAAVAPLPPSTPSSNNFLMDENVPFMTKVRTQDALKAQGLTDEQIAALTTPQIRERLANQSNPIPATPEFQTLGRSAQPPAPVRPPPTAEQDAEAEYRAELLADASDAQSAGGMELREAIIDAGGLPSKASPQRAAYAGEISRIEEAARNPHRTERGPVNKLFRNDAPDLDELATRLRDRGFNVETPGDLHTLIEDRFRTGRPVYGGGSETGRIAERSSRYSATPESLSTPAPRRVRERAGSGPGREVLTVNLKPGDVVDWHGVRRTVAGIAGSVTESKLFFDGSPYPFTRMAQPGERPTMKLKAEHYVVFDDGSRVKVNGPQRTRLYGNATQIRGKESGTQPGPSVTPSGGAVSRIQEEPQSFGAAGLRRGSEGGFISTDGFEALLKAGRKFYRKGIEFTEWAASMARRFGERVREFLHHVWRSLTGADVLPHARERGSVDISRPTIRVGNRRDGYRDVPLRHLDKIPIADLPALVTLTRELGMDVPRIKRLRGARGVFRYDSSGYSIDLDPRIFADPVIAAKVLAHEIGHANDFLPDETLKRGNLLGRLATLKNYLVSTLPIEPASGAKALTTADRKRLRLAAQNYIGPRPPKTAFPSEHEAWRERVAKWYQGLVAAELKTLGLATDASNKGVTNNVREELVSLSDWWKPYLDDAAEGKLSDSHAAYRNSSRELYADMISVLLNSPRDVQERAPTAFKMFFNYLDRKPDVRAAFFEMWDALGGDRGRLVAERRQKIHAMFKSGEELLNKKIEERARTTTWQDWLGAMRTGLDTRYWAAIGRERAAARAGDVTAQQRPLEWLFDAHPLADNEVYIAMHRANEAVRKPLLEAGLSETDLGEYLFFDRVANENYAISERLAAQMESDHGGRANMANPEGHTPETAREQLAHMELVLGGENFAQVKAAAERFHFLFFEAMQRMRDEGMISDEAWAIVEGNRGHYVTFQALQYADLHVPAGIKQQMGYLGEIANPHTSTTLKWITALRAIEFNKAKRVTVQHLQQYFADEITEAPTKWDGRRHMPQKPRDHDLALMTFMQDGKLRGVHVPREVEQMLEHTDSATVEVLHKMLSPVEWIWQQVFYPSYITFSPLFQFIRNPVRDIRRTAVNLPDAAGLQEAIAIRWGETRKMVKQWVNEGRMHPDVMEALEARAIPTPMGTWQRQMGPHEDMFITIASRFGLVRPGTVKEGHVLERTPVIGPLFRAMAAAGQIRELAPKVGAYRYLTKELGFTSEDAAGYVRNWVGTPPWYKKGTWTRMANDLFPFQNIWMKGWQADARLMRGRSQLPSGRKPKSAASWWLRWMLTGALPKVLMAAAAAGLFGETLRRLYSRVGDYWMQNYDVIPLGERDGGDVDGMKTVFIPVPKDFVDRILGGFVYLLSRASFDAAKGNPQKVKTSDAIALGTSDMPSVNPAVKIAAGWGAYLAGANPYDTFRGKEVLTQQQEDAGWKFTIGPMLAWTWQQNGASTFMRWNPDADTTTEIAVNAIPGLNGILKWSDTGLREQTIDAAREKAGERARIALSMPSEVQQLRREYNWLKSVGKDRRTPEMQYRYDMLSAWNSAVYDTAIEAAQVDSSAAHLRAIGHKMLELSKPYHRQNVRSAK